MAEQILTEEDKQKMAAIIMAKAEPGKAMIETVIFAITGAIAMAGGRQEQAERIVRSVLHQIQTISVGS